MGFGESKTQGFNNPVATNFAAGFFRFSKAGFFGYSGPPAHNNMSVSINPTGTQMADGKGNNSVPGPSIAIYTGPIGGIYYAWALSFSAGIAASLELWTATDQNGPWGGTPLFQVNLSTRQITILDPVALDGALTATAGTPAAPTVISTDVWHDVAASAGFTVNTVQRYKLLENNSVRVQFSLASTNVAGTYTLFTLPARYVPVNQYDSAAVGVFNTAAAYSAALLNTRFRVTTGGAVQIVTLPGTAINNVSGCFDIPLD